MKPIGRAMPVTCPACGIGAVAGRCTLTRGAIVTLYCDACALHIENGIVLAHGVDIDPDDIRDLARRRAPNASPEELYIAPEARPLLLVPTDAGDPDEHATDWPPITSLTIRFARQPSKTSPR